MTVLHLFETFVAGPCRYCAALRDVAQPAGRTCLESISSRKLRLVVLQSMYIRTACCHGYTIDIHVLQTGVNLCLVVPL